MVFHTEYFKSKNLQENENVMIGAGMRFYYM